MDPSGRRDACHRSIAKVGLWTRWWQVRTHENLQRWWWADSESQWKLLASYEIIIRKAKCSTSLGRVRPTWKSCAAQRRFRQNYASERYDWWTQILCTLGWRMPFINPFLIQCLTGQDHGSLILRAIYVDLEMRALSANATKWPIAWCLKGFAHNAVTVKNQIILWQRFLHIGHGGGLYELSSSYLGNGCLDLGHKGFDGVGALWQFG